MNEFLRILGYSPGLYWGSGILACLIWGWSCGAGSGVGGRLGRPTSPWFFAATLLLAMIAVRWPTLLHYRTVNPDEPQFIAGALTMVARWDFWWPDGTTSGPLVLAAPALPALLGLPVSLISGRFVALLLGWGTVVALYLTLRHFHGDPRARHLSSPLAVFMICLDFWDFCIYASEWVPLFLCAVAAWLVFTAFDLNGRLTRRPRAWAAGAILGALPFSKLQSLPIGAVLGLGLCALILRQPGAEHTRRWRDLAGVIAATLGTFAGFCLWLEASGERPHFVTAYLEHNAHYAGSRWVPWDEALPGLHYLTGISWGFTSFHYGLIALLILGLPALWRSGTAVRFPLIICWMMLAAAYFSVAAPGRVYPHYLLFLTLPLALTTGLQFGILLDRTPGRPSSVHLGLVTAFLLVGSAGQLVEWACFHPSRNRLVTLRPPHADVITYLNSMKQPGDTLAVWGWRPELYVESQLPQATRDAHTERQMSENPQRDYFRAVYLSDLKQSRPAFFVDAVSPGGFLYQDPTKAGHQTVPDLATYIASNYDLAGVFDSYPVYLRRDRSRALRQ
jgi:hypothetical protein